MSESSQRFKVGDRVRVIGTSNFQNATGEIVAFEPSSYYGIALALDKPAVRINFTASELELVEPATPLSLWLDDVKAQEDLPEKFQRESVLQEAERLINGQRQSDYGHPIDNFTQTGRMWGAILNIPDIPAETVGLMMVAAKVSRETNVHKRDNLVDMAGYAGTVEKIVSRRAAGLDDDAD